MDPIIGALAALVISMFGVVGFTQFARMGVSNIQTAATASQQQTFDAATQQYVQDHAVTLGQGATATVPVTITASQLATAGYLPSGYLGTNSFGQAWQAQVLQPTAGQLETLVTSTGGNPITDTKQLAQIAAQTGASGGFVPYANQAGNTFSTSTAYGTYGSWSVPLTAFANPGSGHLASLLQFTNVQANTAYLYRVPVVNHPELNNMQTDLGLTDTGGTAHNIGGAANVTASGTVSAAGVNVQNPDGWPYAVFGNSTVTNNNAAQALDVLANGGVNVLNAAGTAWSQVTAGNITSTGTVTAPTMNFNTTAGNCTWNTVTMRANNQMWVCNEWGNWVPISQLIGNVTTVQKYLGYADGWGVAKPPCDGGTPSATIIPQTDGVNVVANPPWETSVFKLIDEGTWWYVQITLIDSSGNGYSGNNLGLTAEVDAQCTFGNT